MKSVRDLPAVNCTFEHTRRSVSPFMRLAGHHVANRRVDGMAGADVLIRTIVPVRMVAGWRDAVSEHNRATHYFGIVPSTPCT